MAITKRTHYNPCFWTALWNKEYYASVENRELEKLSARKQKVYCLNIFLNEVRYIPTNSVFFEKHLGIVKFNEKDIKNFIIRNYPEGSEERKTEIKKEELLIDFENLFTTLEKSSAYTNLLSLVESKEVGNLEKKGNIATFLIVHNLRNHVMINSFLEFSKPLGGSKLEHFIHLKWSLQNVEWMKPIISRYVMGHWVFYTLKKPIPLIDSPITNKNGEILCVLNPYLVLTIDINNQTGQIQYENASGHRQRKLFKRILISNTYREVVFTTERQALKWKESKEWSKRRELIRNKNTFSKLVNRKGNNELWQLNGYTNNL